MTDLIRAGFAGLLWLGAFVVMALHASHRVFGLRDIDADTDRSATVAGLTRSGILIAYPFFATFQVLLAKALAVVGALTSAGMLSAYVVLVVVGLSLYRSRRRGEDVQSARAHDARETGESSDTALLRQVVLGGAALIVVGAALYSLLAPLAIWDVLAYHMPMVASYAQNGSLDAWPTQDLRQIYRVNAGELQLLNVALLSGSDAWVELPNALGLAVCLVAAFELARLGLRRRDFAWLVVALVLTAPQLQFGAASAKNDLIFTAVLLGAFVWALRALLSSTHAVPYAILAGICAAIATATKVMGLNVIGAAGLLMLVAVLMRRFPIRALVSYTVVACVTLVVLVGSVYWANYTRAGVPVGVTPNEVAYRFGIDNLIAAARFYLYDLPIKRLLITQVFEHDFGHYGYLFPLMAAGGVIAVFRQAARLGRRNRVLSGLGLMTAALLLSVVAVRLPIEWDQRFMIWLVPACAVLAVSLVERLDERRVLVLAAAATAIAVVNLALIFSNGAEGMFARSVRYLAATGALPRDVDAPAPRYLRMIEGFSVLDSATDTDSVLYIGTDDSWMYPSWGRYFTRHVRGVWNEADAAEQVTSRRQRFIVIESRALSRIRASAVNAAHASGYVPVFSSEHRVILERAAPPPVPASR